MKNKIYLMPRKYLLGIMSMLCTFGILLGQRAYGFQDRTVSGTVISGTDQLGLPGVNVLLKGSQTGTITDIDGNYSLSVPEGGNIVLVFSMIGFEKQEATVGNNNHINITLSEDISALDEVVVVGYGTVKKSDLTGSVAALKKEDFNPGVITSAEQLIAGKMPGVQVVQNSAEPGGGISVNIRGGRIGQFREQSSLCHRWVAFQQFLCRNRRRG